MARQNAGAAPAIPAWLVALDEQAAAPSVPSPRASDARVQLVAMRAGLIARLEQRIEGGDLALLGSVHAAIAAIDAAEAETR